MRGFSSRSAGFAGSSLALFLLGLVSGIPAPAQSDPAPKVIVAASDLEWSPPKLIRRVDAELSDEGRAAHYRGVCLVSLVVDREGRPENVRTLRPPGMGLDASAIKAARQFRFIPAMENDKPVPARVTVEVHFKTDSFSEGSAD